MLHKIVLKKIQFIFKKYFTFAPKYGRMPL